LHTAASQPFPPSLHDALPISSTNPARPRTPNPSSVSSARSHRPTGLAAFVAGMILAAAALLASCAPPPVTVDFYVHPVTGNDARSEEHTSELQSRENLVCRLL